MPHLAFLVRTEMSISLVRLTDTSWPDCDLTSGTKDLTPRNLQQLTMSQPHLSYKRAFLKAFRDQGFLGRESPVFLLCKGSAINLCLLQAQTFRHCLASLYVGHMDLCSITFLDLIRIDFEIYHSFVHTKGNNLAKIFLNIFTFTVWVFETLLIRGC